LYLLGLGSLDRLAIGSIAALMSIERRVAAKSRGLEGS